MYHMYWCFDIRVVFYDRVHIKGMKSGWNDGYPIVLATYSCIYSTLSLALSLACWHADADTDADADADADTDADADADMLTCWHAGAPYSLYENLKMER